MEGHVPAPKEQPAPGAWPALQKLPQASADLQGGAVQPVNVCVGVAQVQLDVVAKG